MNKKKQKYVFFEKKKLIRTKANTTYEKQRADMCNLTIITNNKLFSGLTPTTRKCLPFATTHR
ncbi:MAG: hypothetical protein A2X08_12800 [Bacteroidetes bacterium GWA2_32_17]|nr:MAG: hypothetical protein A2X08_12800 [Bacteroidetes bacterium GWA2_32_17]